PARIPPRPPPMAPTARAVAGRGREPHLEARIGALQPVVQPVRVAVHGGPALERKIGNQENSGHAGTPFSTSTEQLLPEDEGPFRNGIVREVLHRPRPARLRERPPLLRRSQATQRRGERE